MSRLPQFAKKIKSQINVGAGRIFINPASIDKTLSLLEFRTGK
jgi:hypothetical protein